jgi:radical SAM protein with 4Fe4S-binding SPASM domain
VLANLTVSELNQGRLVEAAAELSGLDGLVLQLPTYTTPDTGARYEGGLHRHLGERAGPAWRSFERPYPGIDAESLAEQLRAVHARLGDRVRMIPYRIRSASAVRAYFEDPEAVVSRKRGGCLALGSEVSVEPDGRLVGCPDFPDATLGHLETDRWPAPWQSDRLGRLRQAFEADDLGVCARCCRFF